MPTLDVFNSDAFGLVSLTDAINRIKFVPGRVSSLGIFQESGVTTTSVSIEERDGVLSLVPTTPRGGPGKTLDKTYRTLRNFRVPHYELQGGVWAEEVQNVRAFGQESAAETVAAKVSEILRYHTDSLAMTQEYARVGAIKGVVAYPTGSADANLNLFTEFGVTQVGTIDFDLDNANPDSGAVRKKCAAVIRSISTELDGTPFSGVHVLCGDAFFDDLIDHPEVRSTYEGWNAAADLRQAYINQGQSWGVFSYGGLTFENYHGATSGATGTAFIGTNDAYAFPIGVPGLFRTYYAPADYMETVNTMGRRLYAKQWPMDNDKGVHLAVQMNALEICTRPRVLHTLSRT